MSTNIWGERLAGASFIVLALFLGWRAYEFPAGGSMFPLLVSALMIAVAGTMLVRTFLVPGDYSRAWRVRLSPASLKPVALTAVVVAYVLLTFRLGYYATTFLLLLVAPFALGLRRPVMILAGAVGATGFLYALFEVGLHAGMPSGVLF